jgi:hypothetical protein
MSTTMEKTRTLNQVLWTLKTPGQSKTFLTQWTRQNETVRHAGHCVVCSHAVFEISEDGKHFGNPDFRGELGIHNSCACLDAKDYGMIGLDVPVCADCANTSQSYTKAVEIAKTSHWFEKVETINLRGLKWFDKANGNTYHSTRIDINGRFVHQTTPEYGYGDQYKWTGIFWLVENGFVPELVRYSNGGYEGLYQWEERNTIRVESSSQDVSRQRDLG